VARAQFAVDFAREFDLDFGSAFELKPAADPERAAKRARQARGKATILQFGRGRAPWN